MKYTLETLRSLMSDSPDHDVFEKKCTLGEMLSARDSIEVKENDEPLIQIPHTRNLSFEKPHPYEKVGAPYGNKDPFFLRESVVEMLLRAENNLRIEHPNYRLHIYDAFRPQAVQVYMRQHEHDRFAREAELNPYALSEQDDLRMWRKVDDIWAPPSTGTSPVPPHCTGGAIDVTILGEDEKPLEMGSEFDESSRTILPNYYKDDMSAKGEKINQNREVLNQVMSGVGFLRITHEWWHFSYGDQMWALLESLQTGKNITSFYGEVR